MLQNIRAMSYLQIKRTEGRQLGVPIMNYLKVQGLGV